MNIILKRHPSKKARDFFRDIILWNAQFFPDKIKEDEIRDTFELMDEKYHKNYSKFYKSQREQNPEVAVFL